MKSRREPAFSLSRAHRLRALRPREPFTMLAARVVKLVYTRDLKSLGG